MYKTEINEQTCRVGTTFEELLDNHFDSMSVAYDSDGDAVFLIIPAMDDDYQNNIIYIADGGFEAVIFRHWDDDDLYSIKEVTDLHLKLTV